MSEVIAEAALVSALRIEDTPVSFKGQSAPAIPRIACAGKNRKHFVKQNVLKESSISDIPALLYHLVYVVAVCINTTRLKSERFLPGFHTLTLSACAHL